MKKLLLALFLLSAFVAKAQLFAPPGAEWECRYEWVFPQELYVSTYKYMGDTLYNGVNCQRVSRTPNNNIGGIDYYFYSDTSSIYYFHNFSSSFKKIFDYSLAIGDSLYLYHQVAALEGWSLCDSGFYAQIVGKGVDDINGTNYRYINYEPNFQYGFTGGKYYEKLGFLNGFFLNETICGINDGMYHDCLRLYRDNSSVDTLYNNRSACPVITGINETVTAEFSLFPNPVVDGSFSIQSPKDVKQVELIDMLGQTALSTTTINSPINTGNLAAGLYVSRVVFANGAVGSKRIVVSN